MKNCHSLLVESTHHSSTFHSILIYLFCRSYLIILLVSFSQFWFSSSSVALQCRLQFVLSVAFSFSSVFWVFVQFFFSRFFSRFSVILQFFSVVSQSLLGVDTELRLQFFLSVALIFFFSFCSLSRIFPNCRSCSWMFANARRCS